MEEINKLFTIVQFAVLRGVNKKTLMWYDQIGLFRLAPVILDNEHRLYGYRQSSMLETILLLREVRSALARRREGAWVLLGIGLSKIQLAGRNVRPL